MNKMDFEKQLHSMAGGMEYPPTPDIAASVAARLSASARTRPTHWNLGRSLVLVLVLLLSLLIIPPVRAAVLEFIQIGIVRIFRAETVPPQSPATMMPVTATPGPTQPSLIPSLERMAGEMTLEEAQQAVGYPILLPSFPTELGEPDRVFVQDANGPMTILVWLDPRAPEHVLMSLHFIPEGSWALEKMGPEAVQETTVNDRRAVWAVGPYLVRLRNGDLDLWRLVDGHVLIWEQGSVTYRLETAASLEDSVRIAESLQPAP